MNKKIKVEFKLNGQIQHKAQIAYQYLFENEGIMNTFKIPKNVIFNQKKNKEKSIQLSESQQIWDSHSNELDYSDMNSEQYFNKLNSQDDESFQNKRLNKRQLMTKNQINVNLVQLPDRKPRKKRANVKEEDIFVKQQKEQRRREILQKQKETQQYEIVDKILNDAGRKQKQRKDKEEKQNIQKLQPKRKHPEGTPLIRYVSNQKGSFLYIEDKNFNVFA